MEPVIIAVGSNVGDRLSYVQRAGEFLENLSGGEIKKSTIWESEPIGGAEYDFLNCAARIVTSLAPEKLLVRLKEFEQASGREADPVRWGPRVIDLDLIGYGDLVIQREDLIIPHPEYSNRLFVLLPMQEVERNWRDPISKMHIEKLTDEAPKMNIKKTGYDW